MINWIIRVDWINSIVKYWIDPNDPNDPIDHKFHTPFLSALLKLNDNLCFF